MIACILLHAVSPLLYEAGTGMLVGAVDHKLSHQFNVCLCDMFWISKDLCYVYRNSNLEINVRTKYVQLQ